MGVATGCGYIDFLILLIPTPLVSVLFTAASLLFVHFIIINPRRACARVTVLVLSVCLCVCVCFPYSGTCWFDTTQFHTSLFT